MCKYECARLPDDRYVVDHGTDGAREIKGPRLLGWQAGWPWWIRFAGSISIVMASQKRDDARRFNCIVQRQATSDEQRAGASRAQFHKHCAGCTEPIQRQDATRGG